MTMDFKFNTTPQLWRLIPTYLYHCIYVQANSCLKFCLENLILKSNLILRKKRQLVAKVSLLAKFIPD